MYTISKIVSSIGLVLSFLPIAYGQGVDTLAVSNDTIVRRPPKQIRIGLGLFATNYIGDLTDQVTYFNRFNPGGNLSLQTASHKSLQIQMNFGGGGFWAQVDERRIPQVQGPPIIKPNNFVSTSFFYGDMRLRYRFLKGYRLRPYLSAGLGFLLFSPKDENGRALVDAINTRPRTEDYITFTPHFPLTAGLEFRLHPSLSLALDYTRRSVGTDYLDNLGQMGTRPGNDRLQNIQISMFITPSAPKQEIPIYIPPFDTIPSTKPDSLLAVKPTKKKEPDVNAALNAATDTLKHLDVQTFVIKTPELVTIQAPTRLSEVEKVGIPSLPLIEAPKRLFKQLNIQTIASETGVRTSYKGLKNPFMIRYRFWKELDLDEHNKMLIRTAPPTLTTAADKVVQEPNISAPVVKNTVSPVKPKVPVVEKPVASGGLLPNKSAVNIPLTSANQPKTTPTPPAKLGNTPAADQEVRDELYDLWILLEDRAIAEFDYFYYECEEGNSYKGLYSQYKIRPSTIRRLNHLPDSVATAPSEGILIMPDIRQWLRKYPDLAQINKESEMLTKEDFLKLKQVLGMSTEGMTADSYEEDATPPAPVLLSQPKPEEVWADKEAKALKANKYVYYATKEGDDVSKVSQKYHVSKETIMKLNQLKTEKLLPNVYLRLPDVGIPGSE